MEGNKNNMVDSVVDNQKIGEVVEQYTKHWKLFLLFVLVSIIGAEIYLRYATPIYSASASILLKNESVGSSFSELSTLEDLGFFSNRSSKKLFDELEVIKSRRLMEEVVYDLGLNVEYYTVGNVKTVESYREGITVNFLNEREVLSVKSIYEFTIEPLTRTTFTINQDGNSNNREYRLGETINLGFGQFVVLPASNQVSDNETLSETFEIRKTLVKCLPLRSKAAYYANKLVVVPKSKSSNVLSLSISDPVQRKSRDILDSLIVTYNKDRASDRNEISVQTADFIANRLNIISEELDSVETTKEKFKRLNRITDINSEATLFVQSSNEFRKQELEISIKLELINELLSNLQSSNDITIYLPENLLSDVSGSSSGGISVYNKLVAQRNNLLKASTEKNPIVVELTESILNQKEALENSLKNTINALEIELENLRSENRGFKSQISEIPSLERESRDIVRQQEIKEQLYLYLLQKREETAISMAISAPNAKVIDKATSSNIPIFPKKGIVRLGAGLLGFILVFGGVYVHLLLDNKIHSRVELEKLTSSTILGELPLIAKEEEERIQENDRSILAESFRILRTNLSYLAGSNSNDNKKNVIYVTSTVKGEGKTFVAFNLLLTLASTGKRVVILGADIRNPQVHRYLDLKSSSIGLSEYLYDDSVKLENIITTEKINNKEIDIVLSGRIPPNPAELLLSNRFSEVIESLSKSYDYVIVDTAPTMQVTDTLLISKYADITLFVTRAEYTNKRLLQYSQDLKKEGKLNNLAYVVNGVKSTNFGYGAKYGYGYGNEDEGWLQRLKRVLFS